MAKHIGIVGCSAEGAALCYRTICNEGQALMGAHGHPEVSMHTHSLAEYMTRVERQDWHGVADLMVSSARKLAAAGAEFLICPDNTIHAAFSHLEPRSPLPWLHIARVVAEAAEQRGYRRLGLTGTKYLVESNVYPQQLEARGIAVRPGPTSLVHAQDKAIMRTRLDAAGIPCPAWTVIADAADGVAGAQRQRADRARGVEDAVVRAAHEFADADAGLVAGNRCQQHLGAGLAFGLRRRHHGREDHGGRVQHRAVVHVVLLHHVRQIGRAHV